MAVRKIALPDFDLSVWPQVRIGERMRHATATAVKFIDGRTLLAAQFLNRTIYVIDIETGAVTDQIRAEGFIDLFTYKYGMVVTAEYPFNGVSGGLTVIDNAGSGMVVRKHIDLNGWFPHGVTLTDMGDTAIVSSTNDAKALLNVDLNTGEVVKIADLPMNVKDAELFGYGLVIVVATDRPGHAPGLRRAEISFMGQTPTPFFGMPDALAISDGRAYVTLQDADCVQVFSMQGSKFVAEESIGGFSFPHGCDVLNGVLVVSNYGDNTISLVDL